MELIWHEGLIWKLPDKNLKELHKNCCKLRTLKSSNSFYARMKRKLVRSANRYVIEGSYEQLYAYHCKVMKELEKRGIDYDSSWTSMCYVGKNALIFPLESAGIHSFSSSVVQQYIQLQTYKEQDVFQLDNCLERLKLKRVPLKGGYKNWLIRSTERSKK